MILRFASALFSRMFLIALSDLMRGQFLNLNPSSHRWDEYAHTPRTAEILLFGTEVAGFGTKPWRDIEHARQTQKVDGRGMGPVQLPQVAGF